MPWIIPRYRGLWRFRAPLTADEIRRTERWLATARVALTMAVPRPHPALLDDPAGYAVSNAYGLTNVPTWFFIALDGEIKISSVGWDRKDIEEMNQKAATTTGDGPKPVFHAGEEIADFRAG